MKIKHFLPCYCYSVAMRCLQHKKSLSPHNRLTFTVKDGRFEFGNQLKAKVAPYQERQHPYGL